MSAKQSQRDRLVRAAAAYIGEHGVDSLSLRRLAKQVDASTMVVYTAFGSKQGLLQAIAAHGLSLIADSMRSVQLEATPMSIAFLALAYRQGALKEPLFYQVFVAGPLEDLRGLCRDSEPFEILSENVERCLDAGTLQGSSPEAVTEALWAMVHGMISLEVAGYWPDPDVALARFQESGLAFIKGFTP